ncbi:iron chaperone [Enterococcus gallinarum]|uniref:iron chaperone n=1 Tax=Enterococcus gallinarum TaxID=1353 RepID=UPI003D6BC106
MTNTIETVDQYIAGFPDHSTVLQEVRNLIKTVLPDAEERIRYQMPTYFQTENIVHFACSKEHIGFYPTPSAILAFEKELQPYKTSKGTVRFSFTEPIPYELIARITAWRLQEVLAKTTTD